jgi:hypothetical protein
MRPAELKFAIPLAVIKIGVLKTKAQVEALIADRNFIFMFMEEVEQTTTFWLWHKYSSKNQQKKSEWEHHFKMFLISSFHSSLLSIRKLNDFFTEKHPSSKHDADDIKADRFGFINMTSPLDETARKIINKYLAHMTFAGNELRFQEWNIDDFARPIYLRSFEFCKHLEKNFLDPKKDAIILAQVVSFKRGLLYHKKRVGSPDK